MAMNDPLRPIAPPPRSTELALAPEEPRLGAARLPLGAAACALLVVAGSVGTWATLNMGAGRVSLELGSVRGSSGDDGKLTAALGGLAASGMLLRARRPTRWRGLAWTAPASLLVAALVGGYDWWHLSRIAAVPLFQGTDVSANVGWGLVLVTLGAGVGAGVALAAAMTRPRGEVLAPGVTALGRPDHA